MPRCDQCGQRYLGGQEICPGCAAARDRRAAAADSGAELELNTTAAVQDEVDPGRGPMLAVARFNNAAEAGFFAHELQDRLEVPVRMQVEEDFNALSGYWSTRFLLFVPEFAGPSAAALLRELVEQTESEESAHRKPAEAALDDAARWSTTEPQPRETQTLAPESGINWVPIVLTLAAGSAAFWGARKLNEPPRPNPPPARIGGDQGQLWDSLAAPRDGWSLENGDRPAHLRLEIDRHRKLAIIREDADRDGIFDSELTLTPVLAEP